MIAGKDELSAWLSHPVTVAYELDLRARVESHRRELANRVVKDDIAGARAAAGAIKAYEEMLADLFVDDEQAPEAKADNFRDPAERPTQEA